MEEPFGQFVAKQVASSSELGGQFERTQHSNDSRYNSKFKQHISWKKCTVISIRIARMKKLLLDLIIWFICLRKQILPVTKNLFNYWKNWKPEIINSFNRPYDSRRKSNALAESTIRWFWIRKNPRSPGYTLYFHPGFRGFSSFHNPEWFWIAKTTTDFT